MSSSVARNIRLGVFILSGTIFLVVGLYFIGNKRNLFGSTLRISAQFHNVNGLMDGNNVRFAGIDVGTVERIDILSDSLVDVVMIIEKKVQPYIRKNALASVGTEGLMGNKLVNINTVEQPAPMIEEGDVLKTLRPIEADEMIRTLNTTNENIKVMSENLRAMSSRFAGDNSLWALLMDTAAAAHVKAAIVNIHVASDRTARIAGDLRAVASDIRAGKGAIGTLVTDTSLSSRLNRIVVRLEEISDTAAVVTGDLTAITALARDGEGTVGLLLNDTAFARSLQETMYNLEEGTRSFDENMKAARESWPFKKYFKKQQKK